MKVIELKTAMDAGFAQVNERFTRVDERFVGIDERFDRIDERFDRIDERFAQVDERFARVDAQFVEVRADIAALDTRIESSKIETRRYFDVIAEHLRSDIALLAGAVASISTMLERSLAENASEHRVIASALDNHEIRLTALERRSV